MKVGLALAADARSVYEHEPGGVGFHSFVHGIARGAGDRRYEGALRVFGGAEVWGVGASGGTGERARLKSEAELRYLARCLGGDYAGGIGFTPVAQDPVLVPAEAVLRVVVG